jgi:hypothetical protein
MSNPKINANIAKKLGMIVPDTNDDGITTNLVSVEPHEINPVGNEDLPDMTDQEHALVEGQKQLELLINKGMIMMNEQYEETTNIEPKFRNRHIEMVTVILAATLDAVKHKTDLQVRVKDQRLKEQAFVKSKGTAGKMTTNYNFFGSREELRKLMDKAKNGEGIEESNDE